MDTLHALVVDTQNLNARTRLYTLPSCPFTLFTPLLLPLLPTLPETWIGADLASDLNHIELSNQYLLVGSSTHHTQARWLGIGDVPGQQNRSFERACVKKPATD